MLSQHDLTNPYRPPGLKLPPQVFFPLIAIRNTYHWQLSNRPPYFYRHSTLKALRCHTTVLVYATRDPDRYKLPLDMGIHFDNKQLARGWWKSFGRFLLLLALMWSTYLLASICASILILAQYRTTIFWREQEPLVFQEIIQPAKVILTHSMALVNWLYCYAYMYVLSRHPSAFPTTLS